ncbi:hypothetical protein BGZ92_008407 [Podila epicladia]|nr:hypothetical protein BGZ92_008407 [Podila epicladia]
MDDDFDDFGDLDESALAMTLEQEELESNLANQHISHGISRNVYSKNSFAGQFMSAPRNPYQQANGVPFGGNKVPPVATNSNTTTFHPPSTPAGPSTGVPIGTGVITAEDYEDFGDWAEGDLALAFDDEFALPQGSAASSGSSLNQQQSQPPQNRTAWPNMKGNCRAANSSPFQAQQRPQQQENQSAKLFPIFSGAKKQQTLPFVSNNGTNNPIPLQRTGSATLSKNRNPIQRQGSFAQPPNNSATALSRELSSSGTTSSGTLNRVSSNLSTRSDSGDTAFNSNAWRPPTSAASGPEPLTHHTIDYEAIKSWQYPINYPKRDYQFNIIRHALFTNTLVSLPTGLGKTFIAAVVMLNYFRWFPKSKIIFMAPTKPLVNQQIEACFNICGIPQDVTAEMTGTTQAEARRAQWREKRLFFCTPHIVKNDISSGICPAEDIVCLVIDEAHKASGNYAFATVIRALHPLNTSVRVLALSATPGSELNKVQQLVQTLKVARIEARTEDSFDLNKYMFRREVKEVTVPCGPEIAQIGQRFLKLIQPFVEKLKQTGIIKSDVSTESLSRHGLTMKLQAFMQTNNPSYARRSVMYSQTKIVGGLVAAYDSLMVQGIKLFFSTMEPPESTGMSSTSRPTVGSGAPGSGSWSGPSGRGGWGERGGRGGRGRGRGGGRGNKRKAQGRGSDDDEGGGEYGDVEEDKPTASIQAVQHLPEFRRLMNDIRVKMRHSDFVTHPKVTRLEQVIVQHFVDHQEEAKDLMRAKRYAREGSSACSQSNESGANDQGDLDEVLQTRVIVFANLREMVVEIARVLERHRPLIKVLSDFHKGDHNVLVATSIGEEGLDIGDVDLIVCYDVQSSPTRMIQRMGRTGRKRKGKIVLLMADGRETKKYKDAVTRYKGIQNAITRGQIILYPNPPRILPPGASPTCDLVHIDIPEYINPESKKKSGKAQSKEKGLGAGPTSRAAYLEPEEEDRFRKQYWLPRRNIRKITLESSLTHQRRNRLHKQVPNIVADTTSIVGHSATTLGYLEIMDRISARKDSSPLDSRDTTELDSYSKRMLELLDLSPPPSDQLMFSSMKSKYSSEYDSDNHGDEIGRYRRHGSLDDSDLNQIHSEFSASKIPKRRYEHDKVTDASLSEDRSEDNADLPTRPAPRPKAKRAKKGDPSLRPLDAMFQHGRAASRKGNGGTGADNASHSATKELPSISDDDVDIEIMGGLGGMFKLDSSPVRTRRRVISEDEASDAGALPPAFDESAFDYDFPVDDDWGLHDGDWEAPAGVDMHGDHDSLKGGFDFGESRKRGGPQNWYTSDRSDDESDEPEKSGDRVDENAMEDNPILMVLPPVPPPGQWYNAPA